MEQAVDMRVGQVECDGGPCVAQFARKDGGDSDDS